MLPDDPNNNEAMSFIVSYMPFIDKYIELSLSRKEKKVAKKI